MSRKPTSTRGTIPRTASSASISMPPPSRIPNRPASVMSQTGTSHKDNEGTASRSSSPSRKRTPSGQSIKGKESAKTNGDGEINIQVVVRCRGRSPQEVSAASPIITSTSGALSKTITVETTPVISSSLASFTTASSYGGSHQPMTKTYPFDKVFGPEADQTMIFNEVADGMLNEVLAGYNCTIFAYGQTGTGKTYTMQGDLELTPLAAPKTTAGIVPRVLHRLFSLLDASKNTEFSVKCSYVELYNEELRDLLAVDYKGEITTANHGGLKLYEDGKKGVNIQGLEEAGARNLKEALNILEKGVKRRQTAETKMNTESSRSHTIFSITVHVKETSISRGGEDMLRIGKFNLVDLAGSEAIGRSGATDKRAREAGMINQSLLTLGRVISALVEKGSHIPYRESKLTRLLQDSLGGTTKTCIVATVSPTRSNMEETLSTLDYAIRAKSIRNRPEVNAHLTKAGLLKEYTGDIERLKNELMAAREKNGVYIPEEQWLEMQETQSRQKSDYEEAKLRAGIIEVELVTIKKEFDEVTARFICTSEELVQVREAERQLTELLEETKLDLEKVRVELEEESVIAKAYQKGEERLDGVASELKRTVEQSVGDVGGLFDKLARKAKVLGSNADSATKFGGELEGLSNDLRGGLASLQDVHEGLGKDIKLKMENFALRGQEMSNGDLQSLDQSFSAFSDLAKRLSASNDKGQKESAETSKAILAVQAEVQTNIQEWAEAIRTRSQGMVNEVLEYQEEHLNTVASVLGSTADLVDSVISTTLSHLQYASNEATKSRNLVLNASSTEVSRLTAQNTLLIDLLVEEKAKSAALRTELIGNLTKMIEGFIQQQDQSWTDAIGRVTVENNVAVTGMQEFSEVVASAYHTGDMKRREIEDTMRMNLEGGTQQRDLGQKALDNVKSNLRTKLSEYGTETSTQAESHVKVIDKQFERLGKSASAVFSKSSSRGKKNSDLLAAISNNISQTHETSRSRLDRLSSEIEELSSTLLTSSSTASASFAQSSKSATNTLQRIMDTTVNFLESGIKEDLPTGITPKKKNWNIPNGWERTGSREAVLANWRKRQSGAIVDQDEDDQRYQVVQPNQINLLESRNESIDQLNDDQHEVENMPQDDLVSSRESLIQIPDSDCRESSDKLSIPIQSKLIPVQSLRQPSTTSNLPIKGKPINSKKLNGFNMGAQEERPNVVVLGEGVGVNVPRRAGRR
ncbi:uncharacterized protein I206_105233 [Kwoniella pini CBS 10737]|uniref:Kinesin family member 11 n=1 Tax=Kwoniella pini CBS 10737 TaxID=1296096 RepID=A0A1B9I4T2_9TREE|nr:kinesin family member 11 [Kwoniella pini CBS 10737]OCF50533.1 kinesin family member 11 [Kwoniella pini CBS 10737]